jgi:hypothetical protein
MQEAFCQAMLTEKNQSDAYRVAYPLSRKWKDNTVNVKASELMRNGKIVVRLNELRGKIEAKVVEELAYTKVQHLKELKEERAYAKSLDNASTSLKATELQGKLCGHYEETHVHKGDKNNPIPVQINIKWV